MIQKDHSSKTPTRSRADMEELEESKHDGVTPPSKSLTKSLEQ